MTIDQERYVHAVCDKYTKLHSALFTKVTKANA
jgi:hypothetical protein